MVQRLQPPSIRPSIEFLRALDDRIIELHLAETFGHGPTFLGSSGGPPGRAVH